MRAILILGVAVLACSTETRPDVRTTHDTLRNGAIIAHSVVGSGGPNGGQLERLITIGSADGTGPASFGQIAAVALGADGSVYVLDGQAREVRMFDQRGNHLLTFGGQGSGPGELSFAVGMTIDADGRVWISDEGSMKYLVYAADGAFERDYRRPFRWAPLLRGGPRALSDGGLADFTQLAGTRVAVRMRIDSTMLHLSDTIPLPTYSPAMFGTRLKSGELLGVLIPFSPRLVTAIGPSGEIWTGVGGDTYQLARLGPRGDTIQAIRVTAPRVPLSGFQRAIAESVATSAIREGHEARPEQVPAYNPYYEDAVVDDRGYLWIRRTDPSGSANSSVLPNTVFDLFTERGDYIGTLPAPIDAEPTPSIAGGLLLGTTMDSSGVPFVSLYRVSYPRP